MAELYKKSTGVELFNLIYPIGCVYVQYPQQKSPNELWGKITKWSIINYNGAFFRTQGGNASPYIDSEGELKVQEEGLPNITAKGNSPSENYYGEPSGAIRNEGMRASVEGHKYRVQSFDFDASRCSSIYGKSNHVTPVNYTIRVWKRVQ